MSKPMLVTLPCLALAPRFLAAATRPPARKTHPGKGAAPPPQPRAQSSPRCRANAHHPSARSTPDLGSRRPTPFVAIVTYIGEMIWPARLAVFYPLREQLRPSGSWRWRYFDRSHHVLALRWRRDATLLARSVGFGISACSCPCSGSAGGTAKSRRSLHLPAADRTLSRVNVGDRGFFRRVEISPRHSRAAPAAMVIHLPRLRRFAPGLLLAR